MGLGHGSYNWRVISRCQSTPAFLVTQLEHQSTLVLKIEQQAGIHNLAFTAQAGISPMVTSMKSTHGSAPFKHSVVRLYISALHYRRC